MQKIKPSYIPDVKVTLKKRFLQPDFMDFLAEVSKFWFFVSEDDGSIYTLLYKLGLSDCKCEDCCPVSNHIFKLVILNPMGSKVGIRLKDIELGFCNLNHSCIPSFHDGLRVPNYCWVNVSNCRVKHHAYWYDVARDINFSSSCQNWTCSGVRSLMGRAQTHWHTPTTHRWRKVNKPLYICVSAR